MMTTIPLAAARTFLAGVATVGAILACAPMASADDPSEECAQQQAPVSDQPQCYQQQQGAGMPNLPDNRNSNSGNPQQPQQAPQQPQQAPQQQPP
jgi:hypothetical protein